MKKILSVILVAVMAFTLASCENREATSKPSSSSSVSSAPSSSAPEKKPSSSSSEPTKPDPKLTEMYYDYFDINDFASALFIDNGVETVFKNSASDVVIGAYAICYLLRTTPNYDFEKGSALADFDAVTQKYFGRKMQNYENDLLTLMPNDHIASTGWGYSPSNLVLKSIKDNGDDTKTAVFYMLAIPMEGPDAASRKKSLLSGDFSGYNGVGEIELTFEEMNDNGGMYIKFISAKHLGEAQKPYAVYGN